MGMVLTLATLCVDHSEMLFAHVFVVVIASSGP
jgi:hypothetical protein